eukprot:TRINITY_DN2725_c0_g1_i1.p1 TRINITY_DN2725_c0_g1~~TRINITY_DN2725_c0_g1_i1.p1  ORF type:complete len:554 (-),score=70.45 TRINITY_DN2725_c0_g1_i1:187-1848(-)
MAQHNEEDISTAQNVSKRTARKENRADFQAAIEDFRHSLGRKQGPAPVPLTSFNVYVRKRPIFEYEVERGEFDVVTAKNTEHLVVHKCSMRPDMRHMYVTHVEHPFDRVFDDSVDNEEVYQVAAWPLLEAASMGYTATCFMYGQTGSGKTHSMTGIYERVARDLFSQVVIGGGLTVTVSCFELFGKTCFDLLNQRTSVVLREDAQGTLHVCGAVKAEVTSARELLNAIALAQSTRSSHATAINASSSRSHCFTRICISSEPVEAPAPSRGKKPSSINEGTLTLVDLAGSERNEDSMYHDAERRKECAHINSSLAALKECIRQQRLNAAGDGAGHVPFRSSELTRLLKDAFTAHYAISAVIATVSPIATDTEHSLDTLHHASLMAGSERNILREEVDVPIGYATYGHQAAEARRRTPPNRWSPDEVQQWVQLASGGMARFPSGMDGKQLVRLPEMRFVQACNGNAEAGKALFVALREESQAVKAEQHAQCQASRDMQRLCKMQSAAKAAGISAPAQPKVAGGSGPSTVARPAAQAPSQNNAGVKRMRSRTPGRM